MIGVLVAPAARVAAQEFFELCKVGWEFFQPGHQYEVILTSAEIPPANGAKLILVYSVAPAAQPGAVKPLATRTGGTLLCRNGVLPIYGSVATYSAGSPNVLADAASKTAAFHWFREGHTVQAHVGYDLFDEVRRLLTEGQPVENADIPTLDRHVALLRDLIVGAGIRLVEIPPVPHGFAFITCLTHDIDHPVLRNHRFDHTMFGFLHRATLGSMGEFVSGRRGAAKLWQNWVAVAQLPLVHLRLAKDPWRQFVRYVQLESGLHSTFFVLPERGKPGRLGDGAAPAKRAGGYAPADIAEELRQVRAAGAELGVHGIDAWTDSRLGRSEHRSLAEATGSDPAGIRMHWLYFGPQSSTALDEAGFAYDSSVGYNDTIGFRAGTAQVYRPLGATRLLELPLHVMDTALFYPAHLHLTEAEAHERIRPIADHVTEQGGVLTVNWHDRSIAPERHWEDFYVELLRELRTREAWFPTAHEAVDWFAARRAVRFERTPGNATALRIRVPAAGDRALPLLQLRVHRPSPMAGQQPFASGAADTVDVALAPGATLNLDL